MEQALRLLAGIHGNGSFLGIVLAGRRVLQFRSEEGVLYTEVLDIEARTVEHCRLSMPLAEEVLRAAYAGADFQRIPSEFFIQWQQARLPP